MKRGLVILALGLAGAVVTFCCVYRLGTATSRSLLQSAQPELAWLKHEFNLGDAEFKRISELHAGYLPQCMERCRRIEELNDKLSNVFTTATQVTHDIETLLKERAQMRATCQSEMLEHFFEVSRTMPPEQGKRYLSWVQKKTCLGEEAMEHSTKNHDITTTPGHQP